MAISPYSYSDPNVPTFKIDFASGGKRLQKNLNRYNFDQKNAACVMCGKKISRMRMTGRCDGHDKHTADIVLTVSNIKGLPSHQEIIEQLIEWARNNSFPIDQFFHDLSFSILGNIPDVTILDGNTPFFSAPTMSMQSLLHAHVIPVVDKHFLPTNTGSYQTLPTKKGKIPARILALILAGLMFCEEANRGDRWFCRNVMKDESKTSQLGGAMPIIFFAASRFPWGVNMKAPLRRILR
jgi:hypothetical protein